MWSFVGDKGNKQWIWLALDVDTREIIGVHVDDRSEQGARKLWAALPSGYRQCAVAYTDFWSAYVLIFPDKRHKAVGKETGKTSYIERFNCTMRQRVSRLGRKTLSFSKNWRITLGLSGSLCQCILTYLGLPGTMLGDRCFVPIDIAACVFTTPTLPITVGLERQDLEIYHTRTNVESLFASPISPNDEEGGGPGNK